MNCRCILSVATAVLFLWFFTCIFKNFAVEYYVNNERYAYEDYNEGGIGMSDIPNKELWPGWKTVRLLGRGSFGDVYEIERKLFDNAERAALKVISIPADNSDIEELYNCGYDDESIRETYKEHLQNIVNEYTMMRKLYSCHNIVSCEDVRYTEKTDTIGWDIFIKMELLTPLTKIMSDKISEATVIKLAKDMCSALESCHKHHVLHRDIKPQNIFVTENGDFKLGDFGIAKNIEKTMAGTKIGTYNYMAPEVYTGQPYGFNSDIYSLGLVLYRLLNDKRMPFMPPSPEKIRPGMEEVSRTRRLSGEPFPSPVNGSTALNRIVLKACAYNPKERYQSAAEMLRDIEKLNYIQSGSVPVSEPFDPDATVSVPSPVSVPLNGTEPVYATAPVREHEPASATLPVFAPKKGDENTVAVSSEIEKEKNNGTIPVAPVPGNSGFDDHIEISDKKKKKKIFILLPVLLVFVGLLAGIMIYAGGITGVKIKIADYYYLYCAEKSLEENNLEEALDFFEKTSSKNKSSDFYQNLSYEFAKKNYYEKDYYSAVNWLSNIKEGYEYYEEAKELTYASKYGYAKANKNRTDERTYDYLKELAAAKYKDSKEIFDRLYAWKVEVIFNNSNKNDNTKKGSMKASESKYWHLRVTGGPPDGILYIEPIEFYPGGSTYKMSTTITVSDGYWGYKNFSCSVGIFKVKVYDSDGNFLAENSVKIY